ncbi:MAG TPA: heavy-metal-associated domain-containing protein [Phycisphaerales bacterium]|nr:heavy-metal-associated domain-containing protein [Phycisphaerales bacterium]
MQTDSLRRRLALRSGLASSLPALLLALTLAFSLAFVLPGCASPGGHSDPSEENAVVHAATADQIAATHSTKPITSNSAVLYVNGLGCPLCATNIDKQLLRVDGVSAAQVNLGAGTVTIALTGAKRPSAHDLSESVLDAGFTLVRIEYQ